jgi:Fe-Mn family superoxide dismutase
MNKRQFCKKGIIGVMGVAIAPSMVKANRLSRERLKISKVFNTYAEVKDFISPYNLENHYNKYYLDSVSKLRSRLYNKRITSSLKEILQSSYLYDNTTLSLAGNIMNHRIFWKSIAPVKNNVLSSSFKQAIEKDFGSVDNMVAEFVRSSEKMKGDGWIWLIYTNGNLKVVATNKNENPYLSSLPIEKQGYPVMCIDMYDHAYSDDYKDINSYINSYFKHMNRNFVSERFTIASNKG